MAEDDSAVLFDPGVAYFVSYTPSDECNDMTIFDMFQKYEVQEAYTNAGSIKCRVQRY